MMYEELLTSSQREQLIEKVCTCFGYEALHLIDRHQWLALKPKEQQRISARQVIRHWDITMRIGCKQDLKQEEFEELEKAILYGDAMDAHILGIINRFPLNKIHIGISRIRALTLPKQMWTLMHRIRLRLNTRSGKLSCACSKAT